MTSWVSDKKWSDMFLPEIKSILGGFLLAEPAKEEDEEHNTDLIVLKMDSVRIACRIRKNEYYKRYPNDFTIRCGRPSGTKTELTKIIEGWGNYFFYGFADENEKRLIAWNIINLNAFRLFFMREVIRLKKMPGITKTNHDGSSSFCVFDLKKIPSEIISARIKPEVDT